MQNPDYSNNSKSSSKRSVRDQLWNLTGLHFEPPVIRIPGMSRRFLFRVVLISYNKPPGIQTNTDCVSFTENNPTDQLLMVLG